MGKYLDKTGLQYFYGKLKEKFADKTTIENKLDSLTGALTWKGKFDTLPAVTDYEAGNVVGVGNKEYVLTVTGSTKAWEELGDEGSYLLKSVAEETYLKKAVGEVATANIAGGAVTSTKLAKGARSPIIFTPDTTEVDEETYQKLLSDDVDVILKTDSAEGNICTLTYKIDSGSTWKLYFTCFSMEAEYISDLYLYAYEVSITKASPHTCSITENVSNTLDSFLNSAGYLNEAYLNPILQEINLTGTDADRKAKLDQFASNWKALTGADTLEGARFVGRVGTPSGDSTMVFTWNDIFTCYTGVGFDDAHNDYKCIVQLNGTIHINSLFSHLEPVEIFYDDSEKQKNLDNLNAYKENLEKLGVDTTKVFQIPFTMQDSQMLGSLFYTNNTNKYIGLEFISDENLVYRVEIDGTTGRFFEIGLAFDEDVQKLKAHSIEAIQSITIRIDNTPESKAANVAAIKAYKDNLIRLGIDTTKGYMIPITASGRNGFLSTRSGNYPYAGYVAADSSVSDFYNILILGNGEYYDSKIQSENSSELNTISKKLVPAINEVNTLAKSKGNGTITEVKMNGVSKGTSGVVDLGTVITAHQDISGKVDKTLNAKAFEGIYIQTTNSAEAMNANKAAIQAYVNNLNMLGVDTTKGFIVPIRTDNNFYGCLTSRYIAEVGYVLGGTIFYDSGEYYVKDIYITSSGYYNELVNIKNDNILNTTSKDLIGAINEVNTLAKNKQDKLTSGTNIKTINNQSLLGSGNIKISAPSITVDTSMSNTSTNPVQNKVIKAYIDGLVGNVAARLAQI